MWRTELPSSDYRKLVIISPGLTHLRKGLEGLRRGGTYDRNTKKKNASKQAIACSADQKTFCIYWLQTKLQKRHIINRIQEKTSSRGWG